MRFGPVALDEAVGSILAHNVMNHDGHKLLRKGRVLTEKDIAVLRQLEYATVVVAVLDSNDLDENEGARRVGQAIAGPHIQVKTPGVGRANLIASARGPLVVNAPALNRLNNIDPGITIATLREHTLVKSGQLATLVKIVPFGIPEARIADVEAVAREAGPVIAVRPLKPISVSLIVSGPESVQERLMADFLAPVRTRIEFLESNLDSVCYVAHRPDSIANVIREEFDAGREMILITSVSAIIDLHDVVPTALLLAGGTITHFGMPVDPGTLLMLGYIGHVPVVGAPGCIKSPKTNVVDWVLPRLLAGERLTRADLVVMGHGGLLEDIRDRPMPRQMAEEG